MVRTKNQCFPLTKVKQQTGQIQTKPNSQKYQRIPSYVMVIVPFLHLILGLLT